MAGESLHEADGQQELTQAEERLLREDAAPLAQLVSDLLDEVETVERVMSDDWNYETGISRKGVKRYRKPGASDAPKSQECVEVHTEVASGPGHYRVIHEYPGTRKIQIDRQIDRQAGTEILWIVREPKERKMRMVLLRNPNPAPAEVIIADIAQKMGKAMGEGQAPEEQPEQGLDLRVGDLLVEGTMQFPVLEEKDGDFAVTIVRDLRDGTICSLTLRHPAMRSWPDPEHPYFSSDPAPEQVDAFLSAPMRGEPSHERRYFPFLFKVGENGETTMIGRGIMEEAIIKLWPTLFPKLRDEITAATARLREVLPEARGRKFPTFEPKERIDAREIEKFFSTHFRAVEISATALTSSQQEKLRQAAWNLMGRPQDGYREKTPKIPELAQAERIVRERGFIIQRFQPTDREGRNYTVLIEAFPQPRVDRAGLAKKISNDPFTGAIARTHHFAEHERPEGGRRSANVRALLSFFGQQYGSGVEGDSTFHGAIRSRGGFTRGEVDTLVREEIGRQLGLVTRLPFAAEHRLTVQAGHPDMANANVYEWVQDWIGVKADARGLIVGGREFGVIDVAEENESAYGNVIFRIVAELG